VGVVVVTAGAAAAVVVAAVVPEVRDCSAAVISLVAVPTELESALSAWTISWS
jgi:hypothetical protein